MLLMLDGHRLNNQLFGGITYIINDIPVELIDHIEIIRGPGSAIYGSNAFEAVINLVTVNNTGKDHGQGKLYGKYGSHDTVNSGLVYKEDTVNSQLVVSASGLKSRGPDYNYVDRSGVAGQLNYQQQVTNFYGNFQQEQWGIKALYNKEEVGPYAGIFRYLNDETQRNYTTMFTEGMFHQDLGQDSHIQARLYLDSFVYECDWLVLPTHVYNPNGFVQLATATDYRLGSELTYKTTIFAKHQVMTGASYDFLELRNSQLSQTNNSSPTGMEDVVGGWIEEERNYHYAIYGQDYFPVFSRSKMTIGLRYDNYDKYGDSLNPRLGLTIPFKNRSHMKILYGSAFRAPSYYESNTKPEGGLTPTQDIRPEKLKTAEIEYCLPLANLRTKANGYYTKITDLIETMTLPGGASTKTNQGEITTYGLEAELFYSFVDKRHNITLNGFWNHADNDQQQEILRVANYGATLIIADHWSKAFNSNLQLKYTSPMKKDAIFAANGTLLQEVDEIPQSLTVNLALNYSYQNMMVKAGLYNLFDAELLAPAPSALRTDSSNLPESDYPYNRRFLMLGLEYLF